jgi:hypothetical protein
MGKYWLFLGYNYHPYGGMNDFRTSSDEVEELYKYLYRIDGYYEWFHIFNC